MYESGVSADRYAIRFDGQVVVVTGIGGGFGRVIADSFSACGATVVGVDLDSGKSDYETYSADVSRSDEVAAAFAAIKADHGPVNVLINNAGIREIKTIVDLSPPEWDKVVGVNLNGVYYCAHEAAKQMREAGRGNIVNTASAAGLLGITHRPAYNATKHAVIGLTKNLALDLAEFGIRVNAVAPGTVPTPLTESYFKDADFVQELQATVPLGVRGTKQDVADAFIFLASHLSSFITGVALLVDGGWSSSKAFSYGVSTVYNNPAAATT